MSTTQELIALLHRIRTEHLTRADTIARFQSLVWSGLDPALPEPLRQIFRDAAYDLDYFEASRSGRTEDGSFYGHGRLANEITQVFVRLRRAGVDVGSAEDETI